MPRAAGRGAGAAAALDSLRLRCLEAHVPKEAGDWAACGAIVAEVRASAEIEPRVTDSERL